MEGFRGLDRLARAVESEFELLADFSAALPLQLAYVQIATAFGLPAIG